MARQCGPSAPLWPFLERPRTAHTWATAWRFLWQFAIKLIFAWTSHFSVIRSPSGRFIFSQCLYLLPCIAIEFVFIFEERPISTLHLMPFFARNELWVSVLVSKFFNVFTPLGICNWICICISRAFQLHPPTWTALCQIWCLLSAVRKTWAENWWSTISVFVSE